MIKSILKLYSDLFIAVRLLVSLITYIPLLLCIVLPITIVSRIFSVKASNRLFKVLRRQLIEPRGYVFGGAHVITLLVSSPLLSAAIIWPFYQLIPVFNSGVSLELIWVRIFLVLTLIIFVFMLFLTFLHEEFLDMEIRSIDGQIELSDLYKLIPYYLILAFGSYASFDIFWGIDLGLLRT